ncbi:MAG: hypothetical protein OFPI_02100 [Osedax symbiont Rs2]|nr:MAG: hypothetical protein OFPI_02100 [Osedax symbiont Rs2]
MTIKLAFISQTRLSKLLNTVRSQEHWSVEFELHEFIAEQNKSKLLALDARRDIEVIIAGGGNALMIEEMQLATPLVKIQISGFDVMQALWRAQQLATTAVFINYNQTIEQLQRYSSLFNIQVEQYIYHSVAEVVDLVHRVVQRPNCIIIGASHVCDIAESMHAKSVFIYSQDAIHQALISAQQLALSLRAAREKREKLEAILRCVEDGIIYIDAKMQVEEFNPKAESILAIDAQEVLKKPVSALLPNFALEQVVHREKSEYNQLLKIGDTQVLSNRIAVFNQGKLIGALASFQDVKTIRKAEQSIRLSTRAKGLVAKSSLQNMIGENSEFKKLLSRAELFAKSDASVLIQGETGTGKELIAQGIHLASNRASGPFVAVNCASIPETLLESMLFGYEEGAFTGAQKTGKSGLFELANRGTLFLDEIGELPFSLQGRLLRALQEKEIMRLGSDTVLKVDIRVITATNRDLAQMIGNKAFKEDLFYRINVLNLSVPALRERIEDVVLLIGHFFKLKKTSEQNYSNIIAQATPWLLRHRWPGNIRELENIVERLAIMLKANMADTDIMSELQQSLGLDTAIQQTSAGNIKAALASQEHQQLQAILKGCNNNKTIAAKKLGISRSTLWRKLQVVS